MRWQIGDVQENQPNRQSFKLRTTSMICSEGAAQTKAFLARHAGTALAYVRQGDKQTGQVWNCDILLVILNDIGSTQGDSLSQRAVRVR